MKKLIIDSSLPQFNLIEIDNVEIILDSKLLDVKENFYKYLNKNDVYFYINDLYLSRYNILEIVNIFSNKVLFQPRFTDFEMLEKLKESNFFKVPNYYYLINNSINNLPKDKKLMFKSFSQARSLGKHIFKDKIELFIFIALLADRNVIENYFPDSEIKGRIVNDKGEYDINVIQKVFNLDFGDIKSIEEQHVIVNSLLSNSYYIQEVIEFDKEYRVLYFKDTPIEEYIIEERKGYKPGSKEKREHRVIGFKKELREMLEKVKSFGEFYGFTAFSIDLAIEKETNEIYVFEFSFQFGTAYPTEILKKISKQYSRAVKNSLNL